VAGADVDRGLVARLCVAIDTIQVFEGYFETLDKAFFAFAQPDAGIVVLFVGLVRTFGVTELSLEIGFVLLVKLLDAFPERPLQVGVDIHFYRAVADGFADLMLGAAAAAVEYEVDGLRAGA